MSAVPDPRIGIAMDVRSLRTRGRRAKSATPPATRKDGMTVEGWRAGAPGPASHLPWAGPGAPESLALPRLPSRTPTPAACLHTSRRRTRRSRTSSSATLPSPLAASSPSSAPCWPLPRSPRSPPPLLLGGACRELRRGEQRPEDRAHHPRPRGPHHQGQRVQRQPGLPHGHHRSGATGAARRTSAWSPSTSTATSVPTAFAGIRDPSARVPTGQDRIGAGAVPARSGSGAAPAPGYRVPEPCPRHPPAPCPFAGQPVSP